jgi:hypothetical protein
LLHPFGDSNKSIETGVQSSLQPVYAMSTAGNRFNGEPLQGVASLTIDQDIKIKGFLDTKTAGIPLGIAGYFVLKDCQIQ